MIFFITVLPPGGGVFNYKAPPSDSVFNYVASFNKNLIFLILFTPYDFISYLLGIVKNSIK